jgi:hypothetical protein
MTPTWTDDRIDLLKKKWADNVKTSQIAIDLGLTRNAIIGKAHRLNLKSRSNLPHVIIKFKPWPPEIEAEFIKLWNDNVPVIEMAEHFKMTGPAISKKRFRMGLSPRTSSNGGTARWRDHIKSSPATTSKIKPPYVPKKIEHPPMTPVNLFDRTGCCFPVDRVNNQHLFCNNSGELIGHSIYCNFHGKEMDRKNV